MSALSRKNVLVTGAGRGLGHQLVLTLARSGYRVACTDRQFPTETVAADVRPNPFQVHLDVTDSESIEAARQRLAAEFGPIDILINNAGIVHGGSFLDVPLEQHRQTLAVNLEGLIAVTHAFLPELIRRPSAAIVNIASASALIALPWGATYAATKAAVLSFSDSLREELRLTGNGHVRVLAVCPGFIDTGMFAGSKPPIGSGMLSAATAAAEIVKAVKLNREMLILPRSASMMWSLFRGLPRPVFRWICGRLGVSTSMKSWRGRERNATDRTDRT